MKTKKKAVCVMSPKQSLRDATGQAGGYRQRKKVVVAMSGGIDSSVAAALLKKAGFDVAGAYMRLSDSPHSGEDEKRARKVAKILKIPFYIFNFRKEFKKIIIDSFLKEHKKGITPNPCVACNKEIKFGLFLEKALKMDADFIATGHYARKMQNTKCKNQNDNAKCKIFKLLKAKDKDKDQSYFLWKLNQKQLKRVLFPIGDYTRREIEKLAKKFKLPVLKARKSVEICFIPNANTGEFLKSRIKINKGNIIDTKGKIIGEHQGLWLYTIGQRKGIRLSGGPFYVLDQDFKNNFLIVTKNEKDLLKKELICKNVNWVSGEESKLPIKVIAKIRYRHNPVPAKIHNLQAKSYKLIFDRAQRAITPGQSAVFYRNQELLGGGIIC